jgi:magnesium-transporting ATPase (P-type)
LPLLPAQILWVNVVTNGIADVALGFEPGDQSLYDRPPRPPSEGILDAMILERLVVIGLWFSAATLAVFYWISGSEGLYTARVTAMTTLVLMQSVHVFNCRSEELSIFKKSLLTNKVLFFGVVISLAVHIGAMYFPWTQRLLSLEPLGWRLWIIMIAIGASTILVNELHKRFRPREKVRQTWPELSRLKPGAKRRQELQRLDQRLDSIQRQLEENHELLEDIAQRDNKSSRHDTGDRHQSQKPGRQNRNNSSRGGQS